MNFLSIIFSDFISLSDIGKCGISIIGIDSCSNNCSLEQESMYVFGVRFDSTFDLRERPIVPATALVQL